MRRQGLRLRMAVRVAVVLAIGVAAFSAIAGVVISDGFRDLEQRNATEAASHVRDAVTQQLATLDRTMVNWSDWDATYDFAADRNQSYVDDNLPAGVLDQFGAGLMVFLDSNDEIVWSITADPASGTNVAAIPDGLKPYISDGGVLITHPDLSTPVTGVVSLSAGPMEVVSRAILTSEGDGPSHGTMLVGKWIDAADLVALGDMTHLPLTVTRYTDRKLAADAPGDVAAEARSLITGDGLGAVAIDDSTIAAYTMLNGLDGKPAAILRAEMPRDVYAQGQRSIGTMLILLVLLGMGLVVAMIVLMDRLVVRGLGRLTGVAEAVAVGDVNVAVAETGRGDEVGDVARAFERTVAYLRDAAATADRISEGDLSVAAIARSDGDALNVALERMIVGLRGLVGRVATAADELNAMAGDVDRSTAALGSVTAEVADSVASVSAGTSEEGAQVDSVFESLGNLASLISVVREDGRNIESRVVEARRSLGMLTSAIGDAASAAGRVQSVAVSAAGSAADGARTVGEAAAGMESIRGAVSVVSERVSELGAKSDQIGEIVETIDDIAEQTNLLALNAAIEAARAGEQGKGFAVVADEVRKLAERSSHATKEIAGLIGEVRQVTDAAVAAMADGAREVAAGASLARESGRAIDELAQAVAATRTASDEIESRMAAMSAEAAAFVCVMGSIDGLAAHNSASADEMGIRASSVIGQVDVISNISSATAEHAGNVSESAGRMNVQAHGLAGTAAALARTAAGLTVDTSQFTLPERDEALEAPAVPPSPNPAARRNTTRRAA
jgi:methyl-accepting chemotaxis protein